MSEAARKYEYTARELPKVFQKPLPLDGYTYAEYKTWDEDFRFELEDSIPFMMGSGDPVHQGIVTELGAQLSLQLRGKKCQPFVELDVRLFYDADESDNIVYRPDVIVVCDETKTKGHKTCQGTPDFVIEIVSEWSEARDLVTKRKKYEKAGVKEYWVVYEGELYVFVLEGGKFRELKLKINRDLRQPVSCLEGCVIDFQYIVDRYAGE